MSASKMLTRLSRNLGAHARSSRSAITRVCVIMGSLPRLDADVERLVQIRASRRRCCAAVGPAASTHAPYVMPICKEVDPALAPVSDDPGTSSRAISTRRPRTGGR